MAENPQIASIRTPAVLDCLYKLQAFTLEEAKRLKLAEENYCKLELVMEELVVNVVDHAYPDQPGDIEVSCRLMEAKQDGQPRFCVTLRDWGIAFDPLGRATPDTQLSCEDRQIGGLGIFLAREMTDSISYQHIDAANELTFCFNLPAD